MTTNKHSLKRALYVSISIILLHVNGIKGQNIGINNSGALPHSSAMLDIVSNDKGLLIPRVALTSTVDVITVPSPTTSLLVYNTNTTMTGGGTGFYYWDGTKWAAFSGSSSGSSNSWLLSGNAGTIDGTDFLGTTDNVALNFRVNNARAGRIDPAGLLFLGYQAGNGSTSFGNTAIGYQALYSNTSGFSNTALGYQSLYLNVSGQQNTALGLVALKNNTTGNVNVGVGSSALFANTSGSENTAVGITSLRGNSTGSFNVAMGTSALNQNIIGNKNTALGYQALYSNTTDNNSAVGYQALYSNATGTMNTAVGFQSLYSNTTGHRNTAIGYEALYSNTTSYYNTAVGSKALYSNTSGIYNTAVGQEALYANTTGYSNISLGYGALLSNTTGWSNVGIGHASLASNNGGENTGIGHSALSLNTSGHSNVGIGCVALSFNTTGVGNTAVGRSALDANVAGNFNTALGYAAFSGGPTSYINSTALGRATAITASDQVRVGDANITSIGGQVGWTTLSDARLKTTITETVPGLAFITKLRPVTYYHDMNAIADMLNTPDSLRLKYAELKAGQLLRTGFIAQEVEQTANEIGFEFSGIDKPKNEHDYYGLRYAEFTVPLVKAVQEQQKLIEAQHKTNEELRKIVEQQQKAISELKEEMQLLKKQ